MLGRFPPRHFEAVIHQHMPMFHMEHCVFCHTLSSGKDYRDCGRPCDRHRVDLKDRAGVSHPLVADVGCRNTVYNGTAQSAAEFVPRMLKLGSATTGSSCCASGRRTWPRCWTATPASCRPRRRPPLGGSSGSSTSSA